jgi:enoyl-CoA hydratase
MEELDQFLDELQSNSKIRVLVLSSALDDIFTAGADISIFFKVYGGDVYQGALELSKETQRVFGKLESLPFPVISAVKGLNLTAGLEMSLCCDIIVAADNAKFGQIETKYGIIPGGGGTQRLIRLVGPADLHVRYYRGRRGITNWTGECGGSTLGVGNICQ